MKTTWTPGTEPIAALRRMFIGCVQTALDHLEDGKAGVDIHGARKELKRARALLRLLRNAVGDAAYRRANRTLRDVARSLSQARDAAVLLTAIDALQKQTRLPEKALTKVRRRLHAEHARHYASATVP